MNGERKVIGAVTLAMTMLEVAASRDDTSPVALISYIVAEMIQNYLKLGAARHRNSKLTTAWQGRAKQRDSHNRY
jgi:hypothetical protein